ncbi:MAG: hypothetical protein MI919_29965, partial [Holophagales bacterium]|nr:hypothetical protein [Holophagales bacterium]
ESADVVLDCTGNTVPNALGDGGIPAPGERSLDRHISREVPDLATRADHFAGKTILLVGVGHSAQTALRDLHALAGHNPETRIVWSIRGTELPRADPDDPLDERRQLTGLAERLAHDPPPHLEVHRDSVVDALRLAGERLEVDLRFPDGSIRRLAVDHILSLTGKVGDHLLYRQLQVHECYATSGPMKLAAALLSKSGTSADCLTQTSLGPETLRSPEPGFFILGSKSYGRRTDYLMQVGWQQVDEIFQLLD